MNIIYHFTKKSAWNDGKSVGAYQSPSLDTEGFIHCSTIDQVLKSANKHAANQQLMVLLKIDTDKLTNKLVFENTSGGTEPYPHIYGTLNPEAVIKEYDFICKEETGYELPF